MSCDCWTRFFSKVMKALCDAEGNLPFMFEDYDKTIERIKELQVIIASKWKCVDDCFEK